MKTSFNDYLKSYKKNYKSRKNVIVAYFDKITIADGWLDFENELKEFLVHVTNLNSAVVTSSSSDIITIDIDRFVTSYNSLLFYESIRLMEYEFLGFDEKDIGPFVIQIRGNSFETEDVSWYKKLIKKVNDDFDHLKAFLKSYLSTIEKSMLDDILCLATSEIEIIHKSNRIISFNYTSTLKKYDKNYVEHAHGKLDSDIILGIPFTSEIKHKELTHIFKTGQTIEYNLNNPVVTGNEFTKI